MYSKYYYPISSTSLASIFRSAFIFPAALYQNRIEDVQNRLNEIILLTSNFGCQDCNCCLEVFLIAEEVDEYLIDLKNGFFIYEKPIPISRIIKIHFRTSKQADTTITNIRLSTAFIPESIVDRNDNTFSGESANIAQLPSDFSANIELLEVKQKELDRVLGAVALMRVAHIDECNVSSGYIDALSFFNKRIKDTKSKFGTIAETYYKVFNNPNSVLKNIVTEQTIENQAAIEKQQILKNKITKVIDISNLDGWTYIVGH